MKRLIAALLVGASLALPLQADGAPASPDFTTQFGQIPSAKQVLKTDLPPFDITFRGGMAASALTCTEFLRAAKLSFRWTSSTASIDDDMETSLYYGEGAFIATLKTLSDGLECQIAPRFLVYGKENSAWFDKPLYTFALGEESTVIKIEALQNLRAVASSSGTLYNPKFSGYSPVVKTPVRGEEVPRYAEFEFQGEMPPSDKILAMNWSVNGVSCGPASYWYCAAYPVDGSSSSPVAILYFGEAGVASVSATYTVLNRAGLKATFQIPTVIVTFTDENPEVELSKLASSGLRLSTIPTCLGATIRDGQSMTCSIYPKLEFGASGQISPGLLPAYVGLALQIKVNGKPWTTVKHFKANTDTQTSFTFKAPKGSSNYLAVRAISEANFPVGTYIAKSWGRASGDFANNVSVPNLILWDHYFSVSAKPVGGTALKCSFYAEPNASPLATALVKKGVATTKLKLVWPAVPGLRYSVSLYSRCFFATGTNVELHIINGTR